MSRSALVLSLTVHAGVVALVGWSTLSIDTQASLGKSEIGVSFSSDDAGGLVVEETLPATPPAVEIVPPSVESNFIPPAPAIDLPPSPILPVDPTPPAITTITGIPREMPAISPTTEKSAPPRAAKSSTKNRTNDGSLGGAGRGGGGIGFVPPQFVMRYKPPYPEQARLQKLEGTVLLIVSVDEAGHVTSANVSRSSGHPILDRAALGAVRSWRFSPARQADRAIPATVEVPVRFAFSA